MDGDIARLEAELAAKKAEREALAAKLDRGRDAIDAVRAKFQRQLQRLEVPTPAVATATTAQPVSFASPQRIRIQ